MERWDAITIGSGLGGLAAAAGLARAGKRVLVLEKLANYGGAATIYRHDGLSIEASLHETDGDTLFSPFGPFSKLGLRHRLEPIATADFYEVRAAFLPSPFTMPHGLSRAQAATIKAFPHAQEGIERWFGMLGRLHQTLDEMEEAGVRGPGALWGALVSGRLFEVFGETRWTLAAGMSKLLDSHEDVKLALAPHMLYFDDDAESLAFLVFAGVTARYIENGSYFFRGGSAALTRAMLSVLSEGHGAAKRLCQVEQIVLDGEGRAIGVRWRDGDGEHEAHADAILLNASPGVGEALLPQAARARFAGGHEGLSPSISLFNVSLGLPAPASRFGVSSFSTFIYPDWLTRLDEAPHGSTLLASLPGGRLPIYCLTDYGRLNAFGEASGHLLSITGPDRLANWEGLDASAYQARKSAWIDALVADLERRYPGIVGAITHREMATARTMRDRMGGGANGEVYGFRPTPERLFSRPPRARTQIPGLWLASAYTVCGGYAGAMAGGLMAAEGALAEMRRAERVRARADTV
jgi:phytoene dehydrogenase-like protein